MRLFLLTVLAMLAFAANSVLTRMAVGPGHIGPLDFSVVRLAAGAGMLALVLALRWARGHSPHAGWQGRAGGVAGLLLYLFAFSYAYLGLEAGAGALILFGLVQITMFAGAMLAREAVPTARWAGAGIAFAGLVLLLLPGGSSVSLPHAAAMAFSGIGWGIYSLAGRGARDPLAATGANFLLALPVALLALGFASGGVLFDGMDAKGFWLAVLCGAVTSGLGYAIWYAAVPGLGAARAGVAQLSVPVIAAAAGLLWLAEPVSLRFAAASLLVLGGVAMASLARK